MADESKKIIVDDDWKAEAQREKERLAQEQAKKESARPAAEGGFVELLSLIAMQALVGLGGMATPTGEPIPPNLGAAKHFIDLLQVLEEKTRGNLTKDEQTMMDQTLYELRMRYVQMATAGGAGPGGFSGVGFADAPPDERIGN